MPFDFFRRIAKRDALTKALIAITLIAILARVFALLFLPDAAMTDSLYHLSVSKYIVQNHALPFNGIPGVSTASLAVPLYHILVAIPFAILPIELNLATARVFPFIFSLLQLALSYMLLKRLFPKNWPIGFAFVAMQPLLVIFGALNYLETLATVTVLLCFTIYIHFAGNGKMALLIVAPFAIAAMALSKESATILVPAFSIAFLFELLKRKRLSNAMKLAVGACFSAAAALLSSAWFFINARAHATIGFTVSSGLNDFLMGLGYITPLMLFLLPLQFNASFWFFLAQGFQSSPFGISAETAFIAFTIVTFPVLCFLFYGLAKGAIKKDKATILLLLCLASAIVPLAIRADRAINVRMLVPIMPLFGIAACQGFESISSLQWKRIVVVFLSLAALYSAAFSSIYALNFYNDNAAHVPLYSFIKELPEGSAIAIHPNKTRQIEFISEKESVSFAYFKELSLLQLKQALAEKNVTHIAATCYKNPWDMAMLEQLEEEGFLEKAYSDECSTLFKINR